MVQFYLIRHGLTESNKKMQDDEVRKLTSKGESKVKQIAKYLKKNNVTFDFLITSPLLRSKQTADLICEYCSHTKNLMVCDLLKPDGNYKDLVKFLNTLKDDFKTVALVGHEPFLGSFASYCLAKKAESFINIKKSGVLVLEIDGNLVPGRCTLSELIKP